MLLELVKSLELAHAPRLLNVVLEDDLIDFRLSLKVRCLTNKDILRAIYHIEGLLLAPDSRHLFLDVLC